MSANDPKRTSASFCWCNEDGSVSAILYLGGKFELGRGFAPWGRCRGKIANLFHCEVSAPQGGRGDPSQRDADPEHHGQDEPGIGHHCRVEGEPETEGAHILVDVVADPEQDTPEHEKYGEDDQGASFLDRRIKREPRIADEIEGELLERVEDETRVNVEGRVGLDRCARPTYWDRGAGRQ